MKEFLLLPEPRGLERLRSFTLAHRLLGNETRVATAAFILRERKRQCLEEFLLSAYFSSFLTTLVRATPQSAVSSVAEGEGGDSSKTSVLPGSA